MRAAPKIYRPTLRARDNVGTAAVVREGSPYDSGDLSQKVVPLGAVKKRIGTAIIGYSDPPKRRAFLAPQQIVAETTRLVRYRCRGPCDTDDGDLFLLVVASAYAIANAANGEAETYILGWARTWTPMVPPHELENIVNRALRSPTRWTADNLAKQLMLTSAERDHLGITRIGAIDKPKAARDAERAEKHRTRERARQREKRRANGATPRDRYEARSVRALCERLGISRKTYYQWRNGGILEEKLGNKCVGQHFRNRCGAQRTCYPAETGSIAGLGNATVPAAPDQVAKVRRSDSWVAGWVGNKAVKAVPVAA